MDATTRVSRDSPPPVSADPGDVGTPCFACNSCNPTQPRLIVNLSPPQVRKWANINTEDISNPFSQLNPDVEAEVYLCTPCRSKKTGWNSMCNHKKVGVDKVARNIQAWKQRVHRNGKNKKKTASKRCIVSSPHCYSENAADKQSGDKKRSPTHDFTLFNVAASTLEVHDLFVQEFCRLSAAEEQVAEMLLRHPTEYFLCPYHLNHSRRAHKFALHHAQDRRGSPHGSCVFMGSGCKRSGSRLRPLPSFNDDETDLDKVEEFMQFHELVRYHSAGKLAGSDASGKHACSQCMYIVTLGGSGAAPSVDVLSLHDNVDKWLVRCIVYAMDASLSKDTYLPSTNGAFKFVCDEAVRLRSFVFLLAPSVSVLKFNYVVQCRESLVTHWDRGFAIDRRTMESRLRPVLAGKDIHLKKVGYKTRCYIVGNALEQYLSRRIVEGVITRGGITEKQRADMLETVRENFENRKSKYWEGSFSLNEEISSIPPQLWRDYVLQMASDRRRRSWQVMSQATKVPVKEVFPLCNSANCLPSPSIEECLSNPDSEYNRVDMILSIRALKFIEQVVFVRSKSIAGPLTVCLSIAGIMEFSPSFRSVHNALGLSLSYGVTEKYRQRLIAERERASSGAWDEIPPLTTESIPLCQFDSWDILPLHAVKVDGKPMPKINGSLVQGISLSRKRARPETTLCEEVKRQRTSWKSPALLGDRGQFSESFTSMDHEKTVEEFMDVVFGLVMAHRDQLAHVSGDVPSNSSLRHDGQLSGKEKINFRSLLLSAFKPHGGAEINDDLLEQHVVYVDISRDPASDVLTVKRVLKMIEQQIRPRKPGRPVFVVVSGDQPSFKMLVELWLESWRTGGTLHEWLVPFPGFFHAEKQAMYSLCKEMLDGLGLAELAECAGLSAAHVKNILKHGHARNNRAFLFSLACALVIHTIDLVTEEDPRLEEEYSRLVQQKTSRRVSADLSGSPYYSHEDVNRDDETKSGLYSKTTSHVRKEVIDFGRKLRQAVKSELGRGPNGKHFILTVLFGALLPTVGFHVLSRTGHTDVTEAFWFRLTYLLHSSNHLKYQELSIYFGFLRGILPEVVLSDLLKDTPGSSVVKPASFTSGNRFALDLRGWGYFHLDEHLESVMVRNVKSLTNNFLSHLEQTAAWLMQVSHFRALARRVTGASRAYGRVRASEITNEEKSALQYYDRNAAQSKNVGAMLLVMRAKGFLSVSHRGSEWLTNVFCTPQRRMAVTHDQTAVLEANESGKMTTALHASVKFPDVFGALTAQDRKTYFRDKKFKRWTSSRRVRTPRQFMSKEGGSALVTTPGITSTQLLPVISKRPKRSDAMTKGLTDRRKYIAKAKDMLYLAQREASEAGDILGRVDASKRWDAVHKSRHLISANADAFYTVSGNLCHATKSKMLKYAVNSGRTHKYTLNEHLQDEEVAPNLRVSKEMYRGSDPVQSYFSLQVDVMNAIHYRGTDGGPGTTLVSVVLGKMKRIFFRWLVGDRASRLCQVHLHIDDPGLVISQKRVEQDRRDTLRRATGDSDSREIEREWDRQSLPDFNDELVVPWSNLISNRAYKDELASLHLLCGALAAQQLANEHEKTLNIYLHGGGFVLPSSFRGNKMESFSFRRSKAEDPDFFRGRVVLERTDLSPSEESVSDLTSYLAIPRDYALILRTDKGLEMSEARLRHGESETRFVAAFRIYIQPALHRASADYGMGGQGLPRHSSVILSDDTDVFIILLLSSILEGHEVLHILNGAVHSVDNALRAIQALGTTAISVGTVFAFAGCDFLPGTNGIGHELYLGAYTENISRLGTFTVSSTPEQYESFMCLAYLRKAGKRHIITQSQRVEMERDLMMKVNDGEMTRKDMLNEMKTTFVSEFAFGTEEWVREVRNFVADCSSNLCQLIPPQPHITLHAARSRFVVHKYWVKAELLDLSPEVVGGCSPTHGFDMRGDMIIEELEDVMRLKTDIKNVFTYCSCKGDCNSMRCSCKRQEQRCVGCKCAPQFCKNRTEQNETSALNAALGAEEEEGVVELPSHVQPRSNVPCIGSAQAVNEIPFEADITGNTGEAVLDEHTDDSHDESGSCTSSGSDTSEPVSMEDEVDEFVDISLF